ncbi:MAG: hypothetical protein WC070_04620 [Candidatus Magasanikbacteria bacterium]
MPANLDRLIKLAKKTGSTLIIHDEEKGDVVMMDLDSYEDLIEKQEDCSCEDFSYGNDYLYEMSEGELLDKINRDISIWRSYQEEEEKNIRDEILAEDLNENPPTDPFAEDFLHDPEWHKAGDILSTRHKDLVKNSENIPDFFNYRESSFLEDDEKDDELLGVDDSKDNVVYNTFGQEVFENKQKVPFEKHEEELDAEEGLDEDPVFFEEPV